jgi:hypothetical protein
MAHKKPAHAPGHSTPGFPKIQLGFDPPGGFTVTSSTIAVSGTVTNDNAPVTCVLLPMFSDAGFPQLNQTKNASGKTWAISFSPPSGSSFKAGPYLVQITAPSEGSSGTIVVVH